jgi:trk system potassium uptake protein
MIHYRAVFRLIGILLILMGGLQLLWWPASFAWGKEQLHAMMIPGFVSVAIGIGLYFLKQKPKSKIGKREGYLVVALGWLCMALVGAQPYLISGAVAHPIDAIFESISGLTTTGATIFPDIESLPNCLLYWRSVTQWIGGLGIIVLTVALFPLLGIGGVELFVAEAPGPTTDKLHPRIKETARRLWYIYLGLTGVLMIILQLLGMSAFDALNHAFTTMSTGGFSTKNASIAAFPSPTIQYVIILFMFLAGTNFTILYFGIMGRFKKVWSSSEFRTYLGITIVVTLIVFGFVLNHAPYNGEQSFRAALFQVVSVITTTGFITDDYTQWSGFVYLIFFLLLFTGASAGSTSGGIKLIRFTLFVKNAILEIKRLIHPNAYIRLKLDDQIISGRISGHVVIFIGVYVLIFVSGALILMAMQLDFETAMGATATCLGNVGPAIGKVGPVDNFAWLPGGAKAILSIWMLLGRLELFTILVLFSPYFWKAN